MTVLTDSNVLIDLLRGNERARAALEQAQRRGEQIAASVLTKVELLAGARRGEERELAALFEDIDWIPVDDAVAERAGRLAAAFRRSHRHIEVVDYVVAATAERLPARLWTLNRKHFPMFAELEDPYGEAYV